MPDDNSRQVSAIVDAAVSSPAAVQEAVWHLNLDGNEDHGRSGKAGPYPDRPGEPDCLYYIRTGSCGFGINCRYNHPSPPPKGAHLREKLPERVGQADCGYYLKTGTCKYGPTCKYHHPKDRNCIEPVSFNVLGLPMRKEEKLCSHFMRYGLCKFGTACKFHHPQPTSFVSGFPLSGNVGFGSTGSNFMLSNVPFVGGIPTWPLSGATFGSDPRSSPTYVPVVFPLACWDNYAGGSSNVSNQDCDSGSGENISYRSTFNVVLPQRPDQPECRYFMINGSCKYGSDCKYHHPFERMSQSVTIMLGPHGLPSRPGEFVCPHYTTHGLCKFGTSCKFDHPFIGYPYGYNFNVPLHRPPDSTSSTQSRTLRYRTISGVHLSPSAQLPYWVQKRYYAAGKLQNMEMISKNSDVNSPESANSLTPPQPSPTSSDT